MSRLAPNTNMHMFPGRSVEPQKPKRRSSHRLSLKAACAEYYGPPKQWPSRAGGGTKQQIGEAT